MQTIYIDHSLITAFFLSNHPVHHLAVQNVTSFLIQKDNYVITPNDLFESVKDLVKELETAKSQAFLSDQYQIEKEVIAKIQSFIKKLKIKILYCQNNLILPQILSLQAEYKISFQIAFTTGIMLEHKINTIATYNDGFNPLFTEGLLNKYQA
jgi:hypothetical protein